MHYFFLTYVFHAKTAKKRKDVARQDAMGTQKIQQ
jgi:hypothetical protein